MAAIYDGYISKHINRRASDPMAQLLAKTRVTPNQMSWAAFGIAVLSFVSLILGHHIIGGLLAQFSSIVDGVDGSLARAKGMSTEFGGFLDSVLDRYADILIVLGLTIWSMTQESYSGTWIAGFLAIAGTICISYSRARINPEYKDHFDRGLKSIASRDIRLFLIMIGAISGQVFILLIVLAAITNLVVFYRLAFMYRYLK